jgi:hypothetical protein
LAKAPHGFARPGPPAPSAQLAPPVVSSRWAAPHARPAAAPPSPPPPRATPQDQRLAALPCAHSGFLHRARTVPVHTLLARAEAAGKKRIIFTGHSLGGAVAKLSALLLLFLQEERRAAAEARGERGGCAGGGGHADGSCGARRRRGGGAGERDRRHRYCVDVLCLSFAAPVCCNEVLVQMVQARGWKRHFYNVIVPEDYCLKLFNGVLQSAANPQWLAAIQHSLFKEGAHHSAAAAPPPRDGGGDSGGESSGDEAAPGGGGGAGGRPSRPPKPLIPAPPVLGAPPVLKPFGGMPLGIGCDGGDSSACASDSVRVAAVRFADDVASAGDSGASGSGSAAPSPPPGGAALLDGAPSFMLRSAESLIRAYSGGGADSSSGSVGGGSGSGSGGGDGSVAEGSDDSGDAAAAARAQNASRLYRLGSAASVKSFASFANLFMGERVTICRAGEDGASAGGCDCSACCGAGGSGSASGAGSDAGGSARARDGGAGVDGECADGEGGGDASDAGNSASRVASWLLWRWPSCSNLASEGSGGVGGDAAGGWQSDAAAGWEGPGDDAASAMPQLRCRRRAPAGLVPDTARAAKAQLAGAMSAAAKAVRPRPGSWAASALRAAGRVLGAGAMIFTAPLDVLEAWLVMALRPPPYRHCGHQLILTHQGLRPQVAPLQAYNRHVRDAWNNRELALVVFREHSIVFYKRRIASLVSQAMAHVDGGDAGGAAAWGREAGVAAA